MAKILRYVLSGDESVLWNHDDPDARRAAREAICAKARGMAKEQGCDRIQIFDLDDDLLAMGSVDSTAFVSLVDGPRRPAEEDFLPKQPLKLRKGTWNLQDFLEQLRQVKKFEFLFEYIDGHDAHLRELIAAEAMILSMTLQERQEPQIINSSRRRRIAKGSGVRLSQVSTLLKDYFKMKHIAGGDDSPPGVSV